MRTAIVGAIAALLLPIGLVSSTTTTAVSAGRDFKAWGNVAAPDQVLRSGCSTYRFRYKIDRAQRNRWAAEFFVVGPNGQGIHAPAVLEGANPPRGRQKFEACRPTVTFGRYKIRMKVTWCEQDCRGEGDKREGFVKPTTFRLTRAR